MDKIRPAKFKLDQRVVGVETHKFIAFAGKKGTIKATQYHTKRKTHRYLVLFDIMSDPRHTYWFDEEELKSL